MKHGYTNQTEQRGGVVRKIFDGPDAQHRQEAEYSAFTALHDRLPVPEVMSSGSGWIETQFAAGRHGQDLIDDGDASSVLSACGHLLSQLHRLDPRLLDPSAEASSMLVIQHGDFGPNNVLLDPMSYRVTAVLDWEFSGIGRPITDVAWCEWIVRMHHPNAIGALDEFFRAYGRRPPWAERQDEMIRRCEWLESFARRWDPHGPGVELWQQRTHLVQKWVE